LQLLSVGDPERDRCHFWVRRSQSRPHRKQKQKAMQKRGFSILGRERGHDNGISEMTKIRQMLQHSIFVFV